MDAIDLTQAMLNIAADKKIYDELLCEKFDHNCTSIKSGEYILNESNLLRTFIVPKNVSR